MRIIVGASAVVLLLAVACSSGSSGSPGDAGPVDGGTDATGAPSPCTRQPEARRAELCDAAGNNVLLACDPGGAPPSSECTKTTQADAYCCPAPAPAADAATDAPSDGAANPYGIPYPSDGLGTTPRAGNTRGSRLPNYSFQGYAKGSSTLGTVSLADLYDPQGKTHDVVVLVAGTLWDANTRTAMQSVLASTKRIATLGILGEGTAIGNDATTANLATWRASFPLPTLALDAGFKIIGAFFDASAVPFVMFLDARTMEIDTAGVGASTTAAIDATVTAITGRPPAY